MTVSYKPPTVPPSTADTLHHRKAQCCRFADTKDWSSFRTLFLPTATAKFTETDGSVIKEDGKALSFETLDSLIDYFSNAFAKQQTMHMTGPGEVELLDEDSVKAVWPVIYHAGSRGVIGGWGGSGGGHYHEVWRRVEGEWLIAELVFVRTYWKVQMGRLD